MDGAMAKRQPFHFRQPIIERPLRGCPLAGGRPAPATSSGLPPLKQALQPIAA